MLPAPSPRALGARLAKPQVKPRTAFSWPFFPLAVVPDPRRSSLCLAQESPSGPQAHLRRDAPGTAWWAEQSQVPCCTPPALLQSRTSRRRAGGHPPPRQTESLPSLTIFCSSSADSCTRSRSLLSTTKMRPCGRSQAGAGSLHGGEGDIPGGLQVPPNQGEQWLHCPPGPPAEPQHPGDGAAPSPAPPLDPFASLPSDGVMGQTLTRPPSAPSGATGLGTGTRSLPPLRHPVQAGSGHKPRGTPGQPRRS